MTDALDLLILDVGEPEHAVAYANGAAAFFQLDGR
jgi:hypothetical protein